MIKNSLKNGNFEEAFQKAVEVLGDIDEALNWINSPCAELGGKVPIYLLESDSGASLVMEALNSMLIYRKE